MLRHLVFLRQHARLPTARRQTRKDTMRHEKTPRHSDAAAVRPPTSARAMCVVHVGMLARLAPPSGGRECK